MRRTIFGVCTCLSLSSLACGGSSERTNTGVNTSGGQAGSGGGSTGHVDSSSGAAVNAGGATNLLATSLPTVTVTAQGAVSAISTAPLDLIPGFSSTIHDYYVRCAAGHNALTLSLTDSSQTHSLALDLIPDQAVAVGDQYWVRCLPPDFPAITVTRPGTPTDGYYLVNSTNYGVVFDTNGVPVWYARGNQAINVDSTTPNAISVMLNFDSPTISFFQVRSLDTNLVTAVTADSGAETDPHEFRTLPNGNHLLFADPVQPGFDLTGLSTFGANQNILGCEIEEIDPAGNLVWSWLASDHVDPVRESLEPMAETAAQTSPVDVYHCNAIEPDKTGNLLISMRHANALFYVERASGRVLWKLGGAAYNKDGAMLIAVEGDSEGTFAMQHDARLRANGNLTLFDDHGVGAGVARGVEYALDFSAGVATPVFQFLGSGISQFEGSFRRYDDGESVIGWGHVPNDPRILTEVDANGSDVFDLAFDDAEVSYRAIKVPLAQLDINLLRKTTGQ